MFDIVPKPSLKMVIGSFGFLLLTVGFYYFLVQLG